MKNNRGIRARLPFRMPRGAAFVGRSGRVMMVLAMVFVLQACAEKDSNFFAPAAEDGPQVRVPSPDELDGPWNIEYSVVSNTCEESLADFDVNADFNTYLSGTWLLDVLPDGSATPIRGPYNTETGVYTGESAPVSIGNGEFSEEAWDVRFLKNTRDIPAMNGTSVERITSGGLPVCERTFEVTGAKLVAVPI